MPAEDATAGHSRDLPRTAAPVAPRRAGAFLYPGNTFAVSLLALLAGMLVSFMAIGWRAPYWNSAGSDMVMAYEGLLYNDRLPREFLVYPTTLSGILIGFWYRLMHAAGLIQAYALSALPAAPTVAQFDRTWQSLVEAGRLYSLLLGAGYVTLVMVMIRRLTRSWEVAALAGVALAFSSGVALEYRIIRSELISSALVTIALLATLLAARERRGAAPFVWLALAGLCTSLAILEKVQALLPALLVPPVAVFFAARDREQERDADARGTAVARSVWDDATWGTVLISAALAAVVVLPALRELAQGIARFGAAEPVAYQPLPLGLSGRYQWLLLGYVGAAMMAFGVLGRMPRPRIALAFCAMSAGLALGFLAVNLNYHPQGLIAVANPFEHLQAYSGGGGSGLPDGSALGAVGRLAAAVLKSLRIHTLVLYPSHRPTLFIEWLSWAAAFVLWRRGRPLAALRIVVLILAAIGLDAVFTLRQYKVFYLPYSDPFLIVAGAFAAASFLDVLLAPRYTRAIVAVMAVYIAWGHAQAGRAAYGRHDKEGKVCIVVTKTTSRLDIPYCRPPV